VASTDSSGNAMKAYTANIDAGTYVVKASFEGNSDFRVSEGTSNLIINPVTGAENLPPPDSKPSSNGSLNYTNYVIAAIVILAILGVLGYTVRSRWKKNPNS